MRQIRLEEREKMKMINRDDMLALTRRMTPSRTSITRVAGAYFDEDGYLDNTVNIHFLKLSAAEKTQILEMAKAIPFAKTNKQLVEYKFPESAKKPGSMYQMLQAMKDCELKNDALLLTFYEYMGQNILIDNGYGMFLFHDRYDIPVKGADKKRQGESEGMFEYIICSIFPVDENYDPAGDAICGFMYPAFSDGGAYPDCIDIYNLDPESPMEALTEVLGIS